MIVRASDVHELEPSVLAPADDAFGCVEQRQLRTGPGRGSLDPPHGGRALRLVHPRTVSNTCSPDKAGLRLAIRAGGTDNGLVAALSDEDVRAGLARLPGWVRDGDSIVREYELASFRAVIDAVGRIADAAEAADHHPDLDIRYRRLHVGLSTHSEGGITGKDLALAADVDQAVR